MATLQRRLMHPAAPRRLASVVGDDEVSVFLREGRLIVSCTCGVEACVHARHALTWLCNPEAAGVTSTSAEVRTPLSMVPRAPDVDLAPLADALDALLLAVVRAGTAAQGSATIRDAIEQVVSKAERPTPLGLSRWLGRLQEALNRGDPGKIARVLEGARRFTDDIRTLALRADPAQRRHSLQRMTAWLGASVTAGRAVEPLEDVVLIEVAREWLAGGPRERIERRYLMDLARGELLREERARAVMDASVGPCPRIVQVAFGEVEAFGDPKRVRLLQYAVSPRPTEQHWAKVERFTARLVRQLAATYAAAMSACPGISEPFVLFAPRRLSAERPELIDADGERLAVLADAERPLFETLRAVCEGGRLLWVSGRLIGVAGSLFIRPASALVQVGDRPRLCRIT
jgi:hypothetical protein